MSSIAKQFSGVNLRGLVLTLFVAAIVAGLFFIPEIVSAFRGKSGSGAGFLNSLVTKVQDADRSDGVDLPSRALSEDESERFEQLTEKITEAKRAKLPDLFSKGVTWASLRSKESVSALRRAQSDAVSLANSIGADYPESKFALYSFSGGIKFVLESKDKSLSADQAFRYLERLDLATTDSLIKEGVPDSIFNQWILISLGPVFKHSRMIHQKDLFTKPFDPVLRVESANILQAAVGSEALNKVTTPYVSAIFSVRSKDIKRVDFFHNGAFLFSRSPSRVLTDGRKLIYIYGKEARGIYTLRVVDKTGQIFEKNYTFYVPATRFYWDRARGGVYQIPYRFGNPMYEKLFAMGPGVLRGMPGTGAVMSTDNRNFSTF